MKNGIEVGYEGTITNAEKLNKLNDVNKIINSVYTDLPGTRGKIGKITIWDRQGATTYSHAVADDGTILTWDIKVSKYRVLDAQTKSDGVFMAGDKGFEWGCYLEDYNFNHAVIDKKFISGTSVRSADDMVTHELGHAMLIPDHDDWLKIRRSYEDWALKNDGLFSAYGAKSYDEGLAEAFVELRRGTYKKGMLPLEHENAMLAAYEKLKGL